MHRLPSIIEEMEGKLTKLLNKEKRSDSEQIALEKQIRLIEALKDIYETHNKMTMWDYFVETQKAYDTLSERDKEMDGLDIIINFKPNSNKHGRITF